MERGKCKLDASQTPTGGSFDSNALGMTLLNTPSLDGLSTDLSGSTAVSGNPSITTTAHLESNQLLTPDCQPLAFMQNTFPHSIQQEGLGILPHHNSHRRVNSAVGSVGTPIGSAPIDDLSFATTVGASTPLGILDGLTAGGLSALSSTPFSSTPSSPSAKKKAPLTTTAARKKNLVLVDDDGKKVVFKPHYCKLCFKQYKSLDGLKYHSRIQHPELTFEAIRGSVKLPEELA